MNGEGLKFLANRADTVSGGRADQRLAEVHARIRSVRRRRAAEAVAGASAAALALVIGIAVLTGPTGTHRDNEPIPPVDSPAKTDTPAAATTRQIVYGEGWPIRTIHVGDQVVDVSDLLPGGSSTPVYLNTTDDGVVVTVDTDDSRIWFTDGTHVVPIGQVGRYTHIGNSPVVTGASGSVAAWPDWSGGSTQLVVYDTGQRAEVARIACPKCGEPDVVGNHVYWAENETVSREPTTMFDPASGETNHVPAGAYAQDLASQPRGLIVGGSRGTATVSSGYGVAFRSDGRRLTPVRDLGPASPGVTHWGPTLASDTGSGRELDLKLPASVPTNLLFTVFDWLDDDRLALVADSNPGDEGWQIVVCRITADQCRLAVPPAHDRRWPANLDFP